MSINENIWELAEAYLSGSLSQEEFAITKNRLASDTQFANEFYEATDLIRSMAGSGKQKRFRSMLRDIHQKQTVEAPKKPAKLIPLSPQFWRTAAVAASVALLTSTITYWSLHPSIKKSDSQYNIIRREVEDIKKSQSKLTQTQHQLEKDIKQINTPPIGTVKYTGTGFAINNDGYFVTSNHVTEGADSVYILDRTGAYFKATKITYSAESDLAILKIEKKNFHFAKGEVPYTFANNKTSLGTHIFTLGYPKDDIVYSEGYISSKNGYDGNDLQYTLELPAGHGQSGSPVIDEKGNILGIVTAIGSEAEANTYAVSSKALLELLHKQLPDNTLRLPKANSLGRLSRQDQIKKMELYTFSVKAYKK